MERRVIAFTPPTRSSDCSEHQQPKILIPLEQILRRRSTSLGSSCTERFPLAPAGSKDDAYHPTLHDRRQKNSALDKISTLQPLHIIDIECKSLNNTPSSVASSATSSKGSAGYTFTPISACSSKSSATSPITLNTVSHYPAYPHDRRSEERPTTRVASSLPQSSPQTTSQVQQRKIVIAHKIVNRDLTSAHYRLQAALKTNFEISAQRNLSPGTSPESQAFGRNKSEADSNSSSSGYGQKLEQTCLMDVAGGFIGEGIRHEVLQFLDILLPTVTDGSGNDHVNIVEYGASNTRSSKLISAAIGHLQPPSTAPVVCNSDESDDAFDEPNGLTFSVTHVDGPACDFRPHHRLLEKSADSYTRRYANIVFPSFVSRPFVSRVAPPSSVSLGFSFMDLHWPRTLSPSRAPTSESAFYELSLFLRQRAYEFRSGGLLFLAFICRRATVNSLSASNGPATQRSPSPPVMSRGRSRSQPVRPTFHKRSSKFGFSTDIWSGISAALGPCLQRLVVAGYIKPDIARDLLALPLYPRDEDEIARVLANSPNWSVVTAQGIRSQHLAFTPDTIVMEEPLRLVHPAVSGLQSETLGRAAYAEHAVQLVKTLYEARVRIVLRERAKLSRSTIETCVDNLFQTLREKVEEGAMDNLEFEICVLTLRKV